ncbi:MAG: acyl carrier protein [Pseudomonadota bacterium]|nr:acyl carrier protein [Pseudomonadota bacterium]
MTSQAISGWLANYLSTLLDIDIGQVDTALSFDDYGIDSRDAFGMVGELADWMGVDLEPTIIHDYPSIDELSSHLSEIRAD